jgi:ABC-type polysaccharide/polyol phosphate export permease
MRIIRAIFASMWMGWQRELGWVNPALSLLLKAAAPVAMVLMAMMVFWFGSNQAGSLSTAQVAYGLAYVVIGASLYGQISMYAWVPTSAIAEGKNTNIFPQVYITPVSSVPYLAGRCLASFVDSIPIVAISFTIAYYVSLSLFSYSLPFTISPASILMIAVAMFASFPAALGLGYVLGAYSIFASKLEWAIPSYIAGTLMIFSEALFPSSVLPSPLSLVSQILPFTYFMRASRAALLDVSYQDYLVFVGYTILGGLLLLLLGYAVFKWAERRAKMKGFIDKKTI